MIIYDKVSKNEVYFTQGGGTATGWIFECSTDESPEQSYSSADYVSILPSDKSKIRRQYGIGSYVVDFIVLN